MEQCFLFAALDDKELQIVIGAMVEKTADVGQQIIREGDDGDVCRPEGNCEIQRHEKAIFVL